MSTGSKDVSGSGSASVVTPSLGDEETPSVSVRVGSEGTCVDDVEREGSPSRSLESVSRSQLEMNKLTHSEGMDSASGIEFT
jgi:hypothetical protein